jgi:hypothetical protein
LVRLQESNSKSKQLILLSYICALNIQANIGANKRLGRLWTNTAQRIDRHNFGLGGIQTRNPGAGVASRDSAEDCQTTRSCSLNGSATSSSNRLAHNANPFLPTTTGAKPDTFAAARASRDHS